MDDLITLLIAEKCVNNLFNQFISSIHGRLYLIITQYYTDDFNFDEEEIEAMTRDGLYKNGYIVEREIVDLDYIPHVSNSINDQGELCWVIKPIATEIPRVGCYDELGIYWYDADVENQLEFNSDLPIDMELIRI